MSDENEVQIYQTELPSFIDKGKTLDLKALSRELGKHQGTAIEALVKLLTDEKTEPKIKLAAATNLLELQIKVRDKISADAIARLIAEVKLNPTKRKTLVDENGETPLVDFGSVQKVG